MLGRPRKYTEKLLSKSIAIPETTFKYLEDTCAENGFSFNELVISSLITRDKTKTDDLIYKINELNKNLSDSIKLSSEIKKGIGGVKRIKVNIFSEFEDVPEIKSYIEKHELEILQDLKLPLYQKSGITLLADKYYRKMEEIALTQNKMMKENIAKQLIKKYLYEILNKDKKK